MGLQYLLMTLVSRLSMRELGALRSDDPLQYGFLHGASMNLFKLIVRMLGGTSP